MAPDGNRGGTREMLVWCSLTTRHHLAYQLMSHSLQCAKRLRCYQYERIYFDCIQFSSRHRSARGRDKQKGLLFYIETVKDRHLNSLQCFPVWLYFGRPHFPQQLSAWIQNYLFLYNLLITQFSYVFLIISSYDHKTCISYPDDKHFFVYVQYPV